jgi:hypothetical protein
MSVAIMRVTQAESLVFYLAVASSFVRNISFVTTNPFLTAASFDKRGGGAATEPAVLAANAFCCHAIMDVDVF